MLPKQAQELAFNAAGTYVWQPVAAKEIPAEMIDDGQGVAVDSVSHEELPLKVDGPNLIGSRRVERSGARMFPSSEAASRTDAPMFFENIEDGASRRESPLGKSLLKSLQDLSGAPHPYRLFSSRINSTSSSEV